MRIRFKTEGGFAYFPGLSKPVTIDTDELPAEEAKELERLIEAADFLTRRRPPRRHVVPPTIASTRSLLRPRDATTRRG
jgi:hypothetical protein